MNAVPAETLERRLGHRFRDPALLRQALTHRSAGGHHNERLEFLGDAVLGLVIAEALYRRAPGAAEGDLSRLRASLVNRDSLAELARGLELGEAIRLGSGELKSGGFRRASILADALEAVLGAVYLDGGFEAARACIGRLYEQRLAELPAAAELKDPKTRLQEYLQARHIALPSYQVVEVSGPPHRQQFQVACRIEALDVVTRAAGDSRRRAEQAAAQAMLDRLGAAPAVAADHGD